MASQWQYTHGGETFGPLSSAQLKQLAAAGRIERSDRVWKDGMADWVPAGNLKGLFSEAPPRAVHDALPPVIRATAGVETPAAAPGGAAAGPVPGRRMPALAWFGVAVVAAGVVGAIAYRAATKDQGAPRSVAIAVTPESVGPVPGAGGVPKGQDARDTSETRPAGQQPVATPAHLAAPPVSPTVPADRPEAASTESVRSTPPLPTPILARTPELPTIDVGKISGLANGTRADAEPAPPNTTSPGTPKLLTIDAGEFSRLANGMRADAEAIARGASSRRPGATDATRTVPERAGPTARPSATPPPRGTAPRPAEAAVRRPPDQASAAKVGPGSSRSARAPVASTAPVLQSDLLTVGAGTATLKAGDTSSSVSEVLFSADASLCLVRGDDGGSRLWQTKTGQEKPVDPRNRTGGQAGWNIGRAAFSPDGSLLACIDGESYGRLSIWNVKATPAAMVYSCTVHYDSPARTWLAWSKDGKILVSHDDGVGDGAGLQFLQTAGGFRVVGRTDPRAGGNVEPVLGSGDRIQSFSPSPDGKLLATASERHVTIWSMPAGKKVATLDASPDKRSYSSSYDLGFSADGKTLAANYYWESKKETSYEDTYRVVLWDTGTWKQRAALSNGDVTSFRGEKGVSNFGFRCFSPDGSQLVTTGGSGFENTVAVWDAASGKLLRQFHTMNVRDVSLANQGRTLAAGGTGDARNAFYSVTLWDVTRAAVVARVRDRNIGTIAMSGDAKLLATGAFGRNEVKLWDLAQAKPVPYEDEFAEYRLSRAAAEGEMAAILKPAPPITKAQFERVAEGIDTRQLSKALGGSGEVKCDVLQQDEGTFGYSLLTRYTVTYKGSGPPGAKAVFVLEGAGNSVKLVSKAESGLR